MWGVGGSSPFRLGPRFGSRQTETVGEKKVMGHEGSRGYSP